MSKKKPFQWLTSLKLYYLTVEYLLTLGPKTEYENL